MDTTSSFSSFDPVAYAATSAEKSASPVSTPAPTGLLNSLTGLLSKAADTAVDVWGIQQTGKTLGTVYPTGQTNPATTASKATANAQASAATSNIKLYVIGGIAVVVLLFGALALRRKG